jgi:hypothetical protein
MGSDSQQLQAQSGVDAVLCNAALKLIYENHWLNGTTGGAPVHRKNYLPDTTYPAPCRLGMHRAPLIPTCTCKARRQEREEIKRKTREQ